MAPSSEDSPRTRAFSIADDDGGRDGTRKEDGYAESKLVVLLCPCLFCVVLLLIILSVFLTVKFRLFCHTPLGSLIYKKKCH